MPRVRMTPMVRVALFLLGLYLIALLALLLVRFLRILRIRAARTKPLPITARHSRSSLMMPMYTTTSGRFFRIVSIWIKPSLVSARR